jgi:hypothetical protein
LSNEDHCGPCGQYIITKLPKLNYQNKMLMKISKEKNIKNNKK